MRVTLNFSPERHYKNSGFGLFVFVTRLQHPAWLSQPRRVHVRVHEIGSKTVDDCIFAGRKIPQIISYMPSRCRHFIIRPHKIHVNRLSPFILQHLGNLLLISQSGILGLAFWARNPSNHADTGDQFIGTQNKALQLKNWIFNQSFVQNVVDSFTYGANPRARSLGKHHPAGERGPPSGGDARFLRPHVLEVSQNNELEIV